MQLIHNGSPQYGIFSESISEVNHRDFDLRTPLGKKAGPLAKHFGYNHFQYMGIISPKLIVGCALVDTKAAAVLFAYAFEPDSGKMVEFNTMTPLGMGLEVSDSPIEGTTSFRRGGLSIVYTNQATPRTKRLQVNIPGKLEIDAHFDESAEEFEPMNICTRTGKTGWVYAQKVAGVRAIGTVNCEFGSYDLEQIDAMAHHDWSGGYMRRETFWNWACTSAMVDGHKFGLNLSCGVNETSYSENCYWIDGDLHPVSGVAFEYDQFNPNSQWSVRSTDGQIDLRFTPLGAHTEKRNLIVVASDFKQYFGTFDGLIHIPGQLDPLKLESIPGFVEDQYAKW